MQVSQMRSGFTSSSGILREAVGDRISRMQFQYERHSIMTKQLVVHCDGYEGALSCLVQEVASTMSELSTYCEAQLAAVMQRCGGIM